MTTTRPERLSPELVAEVQSWLDQDPDEATRTELSDLLVRAQSGEAEAIAAVKSAFAGPLTFGTAGLRAALGPGPSRMNRVVVQRAAVVGVGLRKLRTRLLADVAQEPQLALATEERVVQDVLEARRTARRVGLQA